MKWLIFLTTSFYFSFLAAGAFANGLLLKDTITGNDTVNPIKQNNFISLDSAFGKTFERTASPASESFYSIFSPHKKFYKTISVSSVTDLSVLQQDVSYKTQAKIITRYAVGDTLSNGCVFDIAITKFNTHVETMGVQLQYNSQDSTQDTASTFAKSLSDIVGKNIRLNVDTNGIIRAIDTSSTSKKVGNILSRISVSGNDFKVDNNFGLMLSHNADNLSLGKSWTDSVTFSNGNKRIITYTVQSLLNNEIVLIITGSIIQKGVIQSSGQTFTTNFTGEQLGKIVADKSTRLVKSRSVTYTLNGTVQAGDKEYPASAVSKINEIIISE
jgi:hypothetical protein